MLLNLILPFCWHEGKLCLIHNMAPYIISSNDEQLAYFLMDKGWLPKRDHLTRIDIIETLELAGAVYLGNDETDPETILKGLQYWRRALTLRLIDTEDCRPIYKTPLKSKSGQLSEWMTMDDIQSIEQQPAQRKIQSLMVRLRILSSTAGWSAVQHHFIPCLLNLLQMDLPHVGSMTQIFDLVWSTVDTILHLERPHESSVFEVFGFIVTALFVNFNDMSENNPKLNSENLTKFVDLVLMMDQSHLTDLKLEAPVQTRQMEMFKRMFIIISRHPELITEEIRLSLLQLVRRDGRAEFGINLLHRCCLITSHDLPYLPIIRLLVQLGADLNSVSSVGNGVLHILAVRPASELRDATARLFVELGAHLDMANEDWMTAADLWFEMNTPEKSDVADLPDWLQETNPRALQCICSRVIRRHELPYDMLPDKLIPFVSLH